MRLKAEVACNFNCVVQIEELLDFTGSRVHCTSTISRKQCKTLLLHTDNMKWCMTHRKICLKLVQNFCVVC